MFIPKRVIFEKGSLDTEVGKNIYNKIKDNENIEIINASSNKIKTHIPGDNLYEQYRSGKQTLVVGKRKSLNFQTCKPSANYQLPLVSGCMGRCEYCYLNTQLGDKSFVRVFTNIDDILDKAKQYIDERLPKITIFEAAVKVAKAGYKIGFIIAPVFLYDNWQKEYKDLIESIKNKLPNEFNEEIIFEVISHRYTTKAKNRILEIFPETTLPMKDEDRKFKYGQFGYGKYIYSKEQLSEMKEFFQLHIKDYFPNSIIKYII